MTIPLRQGLVIVLSARLVLVEVEKPIESYTELMIVLPVTVASVTVPTFCPSPPLPICRAGCPWK